MHPEIVRLGPFVISSYGFMMVVAFLLVYLLLARDGKKLGWDPEFSQDLVFWAAMGGVIGAKVYYLIENIGRGSGQNLAGLGEMFMGLFTLDLQRMAGGIQNFGAGMVYFGGLMGALILITIGLRRRKQPWLPIADLVAPYIILGYAIGRIGCFMVGDDYGIPSSLPWAVAFPNGLPPTIVPVHPTQIYEFLMGLGIAGFLYWKRGHGKFTGEIFALYLILAGIERFMIEFIRTNPAYMLGLSGAQLIGIIMVGMGGFMFYYLPSKMEASKS
ncbi:prolipoprotein diacylglyceryl transferase [Candidatus Neomarinimicrobiota bacterium]